MAASSFTQRIRWLALHGVIRGLSKLAARRSGDPQARLIADPEARNDPAFNAELDGLAWINRRLRSLCLPGKRYRAAGPDRGRLGARRRRLSGRGDETAVQAVVAPRPGSAPREAACVPSRNAVSRAPR